MITVRSLHIYPVKSCRGIDLDRAEVAETGFRHDRRWMVVDGDGVFLSQREHPALATVTTRMEPGRLILEHEGRSSLEIDPETIGAGRRSVNVWKDWVDAVSEGAEAAEWFSSLLGMPCELVRQPRGGIRRVDPDFASPGDRVAFADGYPFLLISCASVDELNHRLETPVPADRFRANIIIDGCRAHAEDAWPAITIGEVEFLLAKPCARCVVITTDQQAGTRHTEPLMTLAGYRQFDGKILFGQNLLHRGLGTVRVGDEVRVLEES